MTWVSAKHVTPLLVTEWTLDFKIEVFISRTDDWHLLVADRCINGWKIDGVDCINTTIDYLGYKSNVVPHSAWAALQIGLPYFETIGFFKLGGVVDVEQHFYLFKHGVNDVFREFEKHNPSLANMLWGSLRGGLLHSGIAKANLTIQHVNEVDIINYDKKYNHWIIDPHNFIRRLRANFYEYATALREKSNTKLRQEFEQAFNQKYYG